MNCWKLLVKEYKDTSEVKNKQRHIGGCLTCGHNVTQTHKYSNKTKGFCFKNASTHASMLLKVITPLSRAACFENLIHESKAVP
jgi:hypothetical protein